MGLEGALNITDKMENSMNSMIIQKVLIAVRLPLTCILSSTHKHTCRDSTYVFMRVYVYVCMNMLHVHKVPGPWVSAWRTNKTLDPWFADVVARTDQLRRWSADLGVYVIALEFICSDTHTHTHTHTHIYTYTHMSMYMYVHTCVQ